MKEKDRYKYERGEMAEYEKKRRQWVSKKIVQTNEIAPNLRLAIINGRNSRRQQQEEEEGESSKMHHTHTHTHISSPILFRDWYDSLSQCLWSIIISAYMSMHPALHTHTHTHTKTPPAKNNMSGRRLTSLLWCHHHHIHTHTYRRKHTHTQHHKHPALIH